MSQATVEWLATHGPGPDRQEVIAEISGYLDDGWDVLVEYQCPRPFGPLTVTLQVQSACKWKWVLDGLWPSECDAIRSHLLEEEWRDGPHYMHETCVVATLATILHDRGIRLDPRTVIYLHGGSAVGFGQQQYSRVSFAEAVDEDGWDAVADYLVEQQEELIRRARTRNVQRLGPGHPKDTEYDEFLRERYMELRNASALAEEAASLFGRSIPSAKRYIGRADWYKGLPGPMRPKKSPKRKQPSKARVTPPETPADRIERYLRRCGSATLPQITSALGLREHDVNQILINQRDQFRYLPGDRWEIW